MARHPEVPEKAIIQAGQELEKSGKTPNPGAIRAHLGYRGGLVRIKSIWEEYLKKRQDELLPVVSHDISFDSLPDAYSDNAAELMNRVSSALEQLVLEAYVHSQLLFENRLKTLSQAHDEKLHYYQEYEKDADKSIKRLEADLDENQRELERLADQNAKLLLENSELKGRLSAFEVAFPEPGKTSEIPSTLNGA